MARLRLVSIVAAMMAAPFLGGCSSNSSNFDPLDWISADWLNSKTPLPGERKAVFPEGVPGVPQGVPKELVKGSQQQQQQAAIESAEPPPAESAPAAKPAPKPQATRPAPKPRTASAPPPTRPAAAPQQAQPQQRPAAGQPTAEWPDGNAVHPPETVRQAPAAGDSTNWPPPDSSTFSR